MTGGPAEQPAWAGAAAWLPLTAQRRIAERHRASGEGHAAFTSGLSVEEFVTLRSVGFAPVDLVMGASVVHLGWQLTGGACNHNPGGAFRPNYAPAPVVDIPYIRNTLLAASRGALDRMRQECVAVGGDGVVGVRMRVRPFHGDSREFLVTGTAVRASGDVRPPRPFTSDLRGQDFAKLLQAGWLPAAFVTGIGLAIRHDDLSQIPQRLSWYNQELPGSTALVHTARADARLSLAADVQHNGGQSAVLRDMTLHVGRRECYRETTDHIAEAMLVGTALVPLRRQPDPAAARPLVIMRLDRRNA